MAIVEPFFTSVRGLSDIDYLSNKPGGSRPGFIGLADNKAYVVKVEVGGYTTSQYGKPAECAAIESFTAQMIRTIWGSEYAADVRLVPLLCEDDGTTKQILKKSIEIPKDFQGILQKPASPTFHVGVGGVVPYAVISPYEHVSREQQVTFMRNSSEQAVKRMQELLLIAQMIGIADLRIENFIVDQNGMRKLIDCGATFELMSKCIFKGRRANDSTTFQDLNKMLVTTHGAEIAKRLLLFPDDKLEALLAQYAKSNILSKETVEGIQSKVATIKQNLAAMVSEAKLSQQAQFSHHPSAFFSGEAATNDNQEPVLKQSQAHTAGTKKP